MEVRAVSSFSALNMKRVFMNMRCSGGILAACVLLTGCGGTKIGDQFGLITNFNQFELEGAGKTEGNPWNTTGGVIEYEGEQCILLTPGTALVLNEIKEYDSFRFFYQLYSSPTDTPEESAIKSDGAGLSVIYYDGEGQIMREDTIFIECLAGEHDYVTIPQTVLSSYVSTIRIQCNAGYYGDGTLDWVILH